MLLMLLICTEDLLLPIADPAGLELLGRPFAGAGEDDEEAVVEDMECIVADLTKPALKGGDIIESDDLRTKSATAGIVILQFAGGVLQWTQSSK